MALSECGTHAFLAAEIGDDATGEETLAQRLHPRLRDDELLTADRGIYSWTAWDAAQATDAALVWRAPTQLDLPVVEVLPDDTCTTVLVKTEIRRGRRARILAAARDGLDLDDVDAVPDAFDERGLHVAHRARVVGYDVPDRDGNGSGELIVLLTNILSPGQAGVDEHYVGSPTAPGRRNGTLAGPGIPAGPPRRRTARKPPRPPAGPDRSAGARQ